MALPSFSLSDAVQAHVYRTLPIPFLLVFFDNFPPQLFAGGRNEGFVLLMLEPVKFNSEAPSGAYLPLDPL